jgi:hypothetical protein
MFYGLTHNVQNLVEGLNDIDSHIGGNELHYCCYNLLQRRWLEWSGGYHVAIKDTTLRDIKVHTAIAGKDLVGPAKERDSILGFFMKPHGKTGELVFKTSQLALAIVIDPKDFEGAVDLRENAGYKSDDTSVFPRPKARVCTHNVLFIDVSCSPHSIDH